MSPAVETAGQTAQGRGGKESGPSGASTSADGTTPESGFLMEGGEVANGAHARAGSAAGASHRHGLLQGFQSLVYLLIVALFIITFTAQPFRIPSQSMEPTLLVGDFLLVNKEVSSDRHVGVLAPTDLIRRGDLIVFRYPVQPTLHLVKRVVGLPGDRVRLRDGHVFIDDRALPEPYAIFRPAAPDAYRDDFPRVTSADPSVNPRWWIQMHSLVANGELSVPANSYFVLGDNRNDSEDSRYWGFVPRAAIVGKPFLIYFSVKSLDDAPEQAAVASGGTAAAGHSAPFDSLADFARWDRALRVIY